MADFRIAVGETTPAFQRTLKSDNVAVDLTGATVTFSLIKHGLAYIDNAATTAVTPASGIVKYVWQAGDLTDTGFFTATFKVVYPSTAIEYFEYSIEVIDGAGVVAPVTPPAQDFATQDELDAHINDTTAAHAATAISNTPAGSIAATTVQAAINELDGDITGHVGDATDAHAGTAITNTPAGNIAATTAQAAINELDTEKVAKAGDTVSGPLAFVASGVANPTTTPVLHFGGTSFTGATVAGASLMGGQQIPVFNYTSGTADSTLFGWRNIISLAGSTGGLLTGYDCDIRVTCTGTWNGSARGMNGFARTLAGYTATGTATLVGCRVSVAHTAGAGTVGGLYGLEVAAPGYTAGGTVTSGATGISIANQGNAGYTTSYGLNIAAQSGSSFTNVSARIDAATQRTLWISGNTDSTTAAGGITFGSSADTNLYRSAANELKTDDSLSVGGTTVTLADGCNFVFGSTNGTKIGTATTQKISFFNKTPIVQPTTGITGAAFVAGAGTAVNDASTFGGYTLKQIAAALINLGILA